MSKPSSKTAWQDNRITGVRVRGYKSLQTEQHVEFRPLTILAGANSSGKSSMMQPLLLLKQTLEAPFDPGPLLLNGPNVRLSAVEQLMWQGRPPQDERTFSVGFTQSNGSSGTLVFQKQRAAGLDIEIEQISAPRGGPEANASFRYNMSHDEIVRLVPSEYGGILQELRKGGAAEVQWTVGRNRCFLKYDLRARSEDASNWVTMISIGPWGIIDGFVRNLIHLTGLRGNPERAYQITAVGETFPGVFQDYVASIVRHWQTSRDERLTELGRGLHDLGLTWIVEARQIDDTQVELRVGRTPEPQRGGAHDLVCVADVGFGVSQALPVVVALLVSRPGQAVYIEQPEIHLHPLAQSRLALLLAEAAGRGVTLIVETHSALLLRAVQTLVAEGKLSPDFVRLHWFTRDPTSGSTVVSSAELDENGAFGDWPADFDEVEMKIESEYLDAVESRSVH